MPILLNIATQEQQQCRSLDFRFLAEPTDVNFGGKGHGGVVMKWTEQAVYACTAHWSGHYCVTVSIGGIRFIHPLLVGQMVTFNAQKVYIGKTSMPIYIRIVAGDPKQNKMVETGPCFMVFLASDQADYSVEISSWQPQTK